MIDKNNSCSTIGFEKRMDEYDIVFGTANDKDYELPDFGNASPKIPFEVEERLDGLLLLCQKQSLSKLLLIVW